jgi:hypothetical protein
VRPGDTLSVVTSTGSNRLARVAPDGSLFGADSAPLGEPLSACRRWQYATTQDRLDFDAALRELSGIRKRSNVVGLGPRAASGGRK